MQRLLHVGCGKKRKQHTTVGFSEGNWEEVRLDIDPAVAPDVIASITAMPQVSDASFDAVFTSHTIEHLYAHEVPLALAEFRRVLRPQGFAVLTCPDIQEVAKEVAEGRLTEVAFQSPAGPISPLDMLFGWRPALAAGNHFMAHKCGFTQDWLGQLLQQAGFAKVLSCRPQGRFNIWALASVPKRSDEELRALANQYLFRPT